MPEQGPTSRRIDLRRDPTKGLPTLGVPERDPQACGHDEVFGCRTAPSPLRSNSRGTGERSGRRRVMRFVLTWLVAAVVVLLGLTMVAATIGGNIGPLEVATACAVGLVVAVRRGGHHTEVDAGRP